MSVGSVVILKPGYIGIIGVESLILGVLLGGVLWAAVNPIAGIVGGFGAAYFYGYLFIRTRIVAIVLATIASLGWALIAVVITRSLGWTKGTGWKIGTGHHWVWEAVVAVLVFYMSWRAHRTSAAEFRAERGDRRSRWL